MGVPDHMDDQYDEIVEMVKQALEEHGFCYDKNRYGAVVTSEYIKPIPYQP